MILGATFLEICPSKLTCLDGWRLSGVYWTERMFLDRQWRRVCFKGISGRRLRSGPPRKIHSRRLDCLSPGDYLRRPC